MPRFAYSSLFAAANVAAAFDEGIATHAMSGRVHREFANLMAMTYGLPLIRTVKQGVEPVSKADALKLADDYRADSGHTAYKIKGWRKQAAVGAALDALSLSLRLGADADDAERVAALIAQGLHLGGVDAWEARCKPATKAETKADTKADTKAETPQGDADADVVALTPAEAFDLAMEAIQAGAFTPVQLSVLRAACSAALGLDAVPAAAAAVMVPGEAIGDPVATLNAAGDSEPPALSFPVLMADSEALEAAPL